MYFLNILKLKFQGKKIISILLFDEKKIKS
jgi:hypothetical protein